jgi:hypothetical protein
MFVSFFDAQSGDKTILTDDTFKYNPGTGIFTVGDATIGTVTGNLVGNVTGSVSGNAGTVTNGVYTTGDQSIGGNKTFSSTILGNLTGSVTGNVTGNLTGNVTGNVTAGSDALAGVITVRAPGSGSTMMSLVIAHATAANTSSFAFNRSRGTPTAPTAIQVLDRLGDLRFNGYNGSTYGTAVFLRGEAVALNGSNVAGRFRVLTTDSNGNANVGLTVDGSADVYVNNNLYVTRTADIGGVRIDNNRITTTETNADIELSANGTGTVALEVVTQSTVGAAGIASSLPPNPSTYFKIKVNGVEYVVPAYAVS